MDYVLNVQSYFNCMIRGHDHACSIYVALLGPIYMVIVREQRITTLKTMRWGKIMVVWTCNGLLFFNKQMN